MRVVFASGNRGKLAELQELLRDTCIAVEPQSAFGIASPPETGATFVGNALIKARHAARASALPAIADDSGLNVDALGGEPGVHSARYAGEHATDAQNLQKLVRAMIPVAPQRRTARYRCALVYVREVDDPRPLIAIGTWEGVLVTTPRGHGGFGYDPIFEVPGLGRTVAELDAATKNAFSHRGQAMRALRQQLAGLKHS
ncbi:MAG: RdgB/HAM1 family non-canonical purine NTP pyrophosphatase [Steroidobacteraceae bacterium]